MGSTENFKAARDELNALNESYKELLSKYSLLLLSAELAVIGFLLQNDATRKLLKSPDLKAYLLISITFTLIAIVLNLIYKIVDRKYAKYDFEARIYKNMPGMTVDLFGHEIEVPHNKQSDELSKNAILKAIKTSKKLKPIAWLIEISLALAAIFGVIFIYVIVIRV
jgi:uncharacterized membrane protein YagU involved in acid resistance